MCVFKYCLAVTAVFLLPTAVWAQGIEQRADSLEREVRNLQARLDSLERVLLRLVSEGEDTVEVVDELAALRAAARAVVPETAADTAPDHFVLRSRNLNDYNPEISVTGDVRLIGNRPGPQQDNFDLREFSLGFQSALDPYSNTKIYFSFGETGVMVEEAYAYWTGLPGGVRVDVGRFRQQLGELNRWHLHSVPETEYPMVIDDYFGEFGLSSTGVSVYWVAPYQSPGGGVHEVWAQVTRGHNDVLFDEGNRASFLGHVNNFWQVSRSTYFQIGATGVYGTNPDMNLKTDVLGADFRLTWRPPHRSLYNEFTVRGEGYAVRKRFDGAGGTRFGGYVSTTYKTSQRFYVGARFDYVELLDRADEFKWAIVPNITFWQSEWVVLRAEWQHLSVPILTGRDVSDRFVLQAVCSIGPHKHESY